MYEGIRDRLSVQGDVTAECALDFLGLFSKILSIWELGRAAPFFIGPAFLCRVRDRESGAERLIRFDTHNQVFFFFPTPPTTVVAPAQF